MIGAIRVALLGDQERKIVRVVPVESCIGIGVATPKGIDTSCFRGMVQSKLGERCARPVPPRPGVPISPSAAINPSAVVSPGAVINTSAVINANAVVSPTGGGIGRGPRGAG
jgi:hypothetical protein